MKNYKMIKFLAEGIIVLTGIASIATIVVCLSMLINMI
jgi:hypothetical protein